MNKEKSHALGFDEARLARVEQTIKRDIEANKYHGASLMVARNGSIVLDLVEGYSDRKAGRPLKRDAVFLTMSVAKQFTNVLALSLVERGALRLHTPIAHWMPEFRVRGKEKVNLAHLLTHTSGIYSGNSHAAARDDYQYRKAQRFRRGKSTRVVAWRARELLNHGGTFGDRRALRAGRRPWPQFRENARGRNFRAAQDARFQYRTPQGSRTAILSCQSGRQRQRSQRARHGRRDE
jgi:CubicO group peptidase (beta-lactamase class C family)